jgi:hypothetical protein
MNGDDLFGGWGEPSWGNTGTGAATNAASLSLGLWGNTADELRCGMCGHYYNDPRTLGCGHSYCASCLTQSAGTSSALFPQMIMREYQKNKTKQKKNKTKQINKQMDK